MGFKIQRKAYKLTFADGSPLDGANVTMGAATTGEVLDARSYAPGTADDLTSEAEAIRKQIELVVSKLIDWDLEDEDGTPIPATRDGVLSLELEMTMHILGAWLRAVTSSVDAPLPSASSDGEKQTLEASIPMELSSTGLAS